MRILIFFSVALSVITLELIEIYNHDIHCYTQGLTFLNSNTLIQSCGLYDQSNIRQLKYNQMLSEYQKSPQIKLPKEVFGEGVTLFKDKIYVLTWREHRVLVFDKNYTSQPDLIWKKEGWGLTHNGTHMFVSDGSSSIFVVDQNFKVLQEIKVISNGKQVRNLNELEYYKGSILANIYYNNHIAEINLETGVAQLHDFKLIVTHQKKSNRIAQVINGIAYDQINDVLLVTGKRWKYLYKVQL